MVASMYCTIRTPPTTFELEQLPPDGSFAGLHRAVSGAPTNAGMGLDRLPTALSPLDITGQFTKLTPVRTGSVQGSQGFCSPNQCFPFAENQLLTAASTHPTLRAFGSFHRFFQSTTSHVPKTIRPSILSIPLLLTIHSLNLPTNSCRGLQLLQ
ncbi:hypothetical protein K449DRAFT_436757 [Hypoxylon sp. EC38]|nr:hypothetical protein K449DRAFT_436757 [Hypoxylon sp. EC38]